MHCVAGRATACTLLTLLLVRTQDNVVGDSTAGAFFGRQAKDDPELQRHDDVAQAGIASSCGKTLTDTELRSLVWYICRFVCMCAACSMVCGAWSMTLVRILQKEEGWVLKQNLIPANAAERGCFFPFEACRRRTPRAGTDLSVASERSGRDASSGTLRSEGPPGFCRRCAPRFLRKKDPRSG